MFFVDYYLSTKLIHLNNTTIMSESNLKYSEAAMLIRKPASEVFQAFIDPEVTKHFWFTKGSDKLEVGKTVTWEWEMYNFSTKVVAREIIPNQKNSY